MTAESRGSFSATGTATPLTVSGLAPPGPQSFVLVAVGMSATANPVTGIAPSGAARTNLAMNPNLLSGITGWQSNDPTLYPVALDATTPIRGTQSLLSTRTATTPNGSVASINASGQVPQARLPVTAGQSYTVGIDIKAELPSRRSRVYFLWYDTGGTLLGNSTMVYQPLTDGSTTRLTHTATAPTGAVTAYPMIAVATNAGNATTGERVWFDNLTIEKDPTATSAVDRTNLAMNGNMEGGVVTGWNSNNISSYPVTLDTTAPISGTASAITTRTSSSPNTTAGAIFIGAQIPTSQFAVVPGQPITMAFDVKVEQANRQGLAYFLWYDAAKVSLGNSSAGVVYTALPSGQVVRLSQTATPPAGAVWAYVNTQVTSTAGNVVTGERIWFDNLVIENGTTDGSYFDGATVPSGNYWYRWTGTANASTSERLLISNRSAMTGSYFAPTFVLLGAVNSASRRVELWVGYDFGTSAPTSVVITRTAGTINTAVTVRVVDVLGDTPVISPIASAGSTDTTAAADSGSLTPAVGDMLFAATVLASTTADSTARVSTGNAYRDSAGAELTNTRVEAAWCRAVAAVPSSLAWTLATSVEWAAIQAKWTPPAPPTPTAALLLKGMTTAALDAASPY